MDYHSTIDTDQSFPQSILAMKPGRETIRHHNQNRKQKLFLVR